VRTVPVSCPMPSLGRLSRPSLRPFPIAAAFRVGAVAAALALAVAGCGGAVWSLPPASQSGHSAATGTPVSGTGTPVSGQTALDDLPPGRGIAEGGGGPMTYTFREEWRRARPVAQTWRSGAYLVSAAGSFVNDDGVPSSWTFDFVDRANPDAVLVVEMDPLGKIGAVRRVTGSGVSSLVGPHDARIPYSVIDSDTAVASGKATLTSRYDLAKTRDPRIGLSFSGVDGSGPYWTYTLFYEPTAAYVSAQIDALTGGATFPD
jgi:hypothetical protein